MKSLNSTLRVLQRSGIVAALILIRSLSSGMQPGHLMVTLVPETGNPGEAIAGDFAGLSFEMERVLPDSRGMHFFSPDNANLIAVVAALGVKSLRVGGNTADRPTVGVPAEGDIDQLFAFARAAHVKVIYTVRLRNGDPHRAAAIVQYIMKRYTNLVDCFAIGNEPNVFSPDYALYRNEWQKYVDTILQAAGDAMFCGPGSTPGKASWSGKFADDVSSSHLIRFISQHAYPGGNGRKVRSPSAGIDSMLSPQWVSGYQRFYDAFVPAAQKNNFLYRLEEANNFYNGGAPGVSNTFAAALWGLDFLHWWAAHEAAGVNFHTGDSVAAGEATGPCHYAVFTSAASGFHVRPLGYALQAFALGKNGRSLPVTVLVNPGHANLATYAVMDSGGSVVVTAINKEWRNAQGAVVVSIPRAHFAGAEAMFLEASQVSATSEIRLGGSEISDEGAWNGTWASVGEIASAGDFQVTVPPATAVLVRLSVK